jgi:hypothetical protein
MSISNNMPDDIREYRDAMRAWSLAAAEWLALDPEAVFKLDVTERPFNEFGGSTVEATWSATTRLAPRVGHVHPWGASRDGETTTFSGGVSLDYDDSKAFWEAVGPKPKDPWETPEAQAAFEQLRRMP